MKRSTPEIITVIRMMFVTVACMFTVSSVTADDTEVYFSPAALADGAEGTGLPNVLFILDTSSSMTAEVDGTGMNRLDNMKQALHGILDSANNINVGLMRFHEEGGPVLFPVKYIDQSLEEITGAEDEAPVQVRISESADDATESTAGTVTLDDERLDMVDISGAGTTTVEVRISNGNDDVEERDNGDMYMTSSDLELVSDGYRGNQIIGMRFQSVAVPQGATITSAHIEFEIDEYEDESTDVNIYGHDVDDSSAFSSSNGNVSGRSKTSAFTNWSGIPDLGVNSQLDTPDIANVIQEIVDRGGWSSGNDLTIIIEGTGERVVESYNGESSNAPNLVITYESGGGGGASDDAVGLRFQTVGIPQGATVTSAHIEFTSQAVDSGAAALTIAGEDVDSAAQFTSTDNDITDRTLTTANVAWAPDPWASTDESHNSPDLTTIVQEIVNRAGWCGGNDMAFVVTGSGVRKADSYDGDPSFAPKLIVDYDEDSIPVGAGCMNQTVQVQVSTGNDDAEEYSNGTVNLTSSDLELINDSSDQEVGIRFRSVNIAQGTTILSAYLQFTVDETNSGATSLTIRGEDADDSAIFTTSSNNVSSRTTTSASTSWNSIPAWDSVGEVHNSPDVTDIVQEIVDRGGWEAGNNMSFIITGSGERTAEAYNGDPAGAPKLIIQVQGELGDDTGTDVSTVRHLLKQEVDDLQYKTGTPIVSTLYEAARYYRGEEVYYGKTRGDQGSRSEYTRVSHPSSYTFSGAGSVYRAAGCTDAAINSTACKTEEIVGTAMYNSPIEESCQANYMVLLSDGDASRRHAEDEIEAMIGTSCASDGNNTCGLELIDFLYNTDQSGLEGDQTVKTFTIGFNFSGDFLRDIASTGGGEFYQAETAAELTGVFQQIFAEILSENSTFVAPAVTLNAFNRLTHRDELYFALFRPEGDTDWPGNIKRYQLKNGAVYDVNGTSAVDTSSGFFKSTSQSWWSYVQDGADVSQGGVADLLSTDRNLYTYTWSSASDDLLNQADHLLHEDNARITKAMLGISGASDEERTNLIQWARGIDVDDVDDDGNSTESRQALGDPLHSKPVLVTYGGTEDNPDITLFASTNHGFLHAIDTSDGSEQFGFIPKELLENLDTLYSNSGVDHPYGLDGPLTVWVTDDNNNGIVDEADGEKVYLYVGMRRGGKNFYALDVTDRANPRILWQIDGGAGSFAELGQTWSRPFKTKVTINGTDQDVLVFGGGYDPNQDSQTLPADDSQGRAIYMVNAITGALVWWAGPVGSGANLQITEMTNSIAADVRPIDIDSDGYLDMIFAADTRAQVFRIDFDNDNAGILGLATGGTIAQLGDSTAADARRFFYAPDVAVIRIPNNDFGVEYLSISLGSGYRAHPLDQTIEDRFYSWRDPNVYVAPDSNGDGVADYTAITESNLYDATANVIGEGSVADAALATAALGSKSGWYIKMNKSDGTFEGEKVLAESVTVNNQIIFTTYTPVVTTTTACQAAQGTGRSYVVSVLDATPTLNLDETGADDELTREDRSIDLKRGGIPPEAAVVFPPDGSEPVTLIGPEVVEGISLGNLFSRTYWLEQ